MIQINHLTKKFGKLTVLNKLNLSIDNGGVFAVLGPNGSGKTTLIKSILGMVIPNDGEIKIDNRSVLHQWTYRNHINYLPQIANFPDNLTVKELIAMVKNLRPKTAQEIDLIQKFDLGPFLNKKLGNLSGGTKQKVNIVLTFMFDSAIIILDEPTTGLDPIALLHLKQMIHEERAKGKLILISTHIMSFVEAIADEVIFLLDGRIYFKGELAALKEQTQQPDLEHAIAQLIKK